MLQDSTYIYDVNHLTILDTIDTVPNTKGKNNYVMLALILRDFNLISLLFYFILFYYCWK